MRYLIRAAKHFLYFCVLFVICILIIYLVKGDNGQFLSMFRNGTRSLIEILVLFAVVSLIYPFFSYTKQNLIFPGSFEETYPEIQGFMEAQGYILENTTEDSISFRNSSKFNKFRLLYEDRIIFRKIHNGYSIEGARRCIIPLYNRISRIIKTKEE